MARTIKRLMGPAQVATGPTTVYTAPASTTTYVQSLHLSNPSGSPVTFTMSIGADAAGTRVFGAYSIAANSVYDVFPGFVLTAAEIVTFSAGTNNILVATLNGYETTPG